MFKLVLVWIYLISASFSFGQSELSILGTYILKEERGAHFVPGISYGDMHPTSYISSVDTTITNTLVLDSLNKVTFTRDTSFQTVYMFNPASTKMTGNWFVRNDTLTIQYTSLDTIYQSIPIIGTITGTINGVEYEIMPDKSEELTPLKNEIFEEFKVLIYENTRYLGSEEKKIIEKSIYAIVPINKTKERAEYRKQ